MRKSDRQIIIAPHITEKSSEMMAKNPKGEKSYVFKVSREANKIEIKKALEKIFSVKVKNVNTICQRGKVKTMGKFSGKRADWKKAIVTLCSGESFPEFEV